MTTLNRLRGDHALAQRFRAGDDGAFAVLYERHRQRLLAICIGVVGSYEDAQDALQNGLAASAISLRKTTPDDVRAWLARVTRNAAIDLARARRPVVALPDEAPSPGAGPAVRAQERADVDDLVASLRRLSEHQRTALVMRELAGASHAEIAETLEVEPAGVGGLIARARLTLRAELEAGELACAAVRETIAGRADARRRPAIVRRHVRACEGCREFDLALRADARALRGLAPAGGGVGLFGLAALLRATRPVTLAGVAAQGLAGTQVLKAVAVCVVCMSAAGGVRELSVERGDATPRPGAGVPATPAASATDAAGGEAGAAEVSESRTAAAVTTGTGAASGQSLRVREGSAAGRPADRGPRDGGERGGDGDTRGGGPGGDDRHRLDSRPGDAGGPSGPAADSPGSRAEGGGGGPGPQDGGEPRPAPAPVSSRFGDAQAPVPAPPPAGAGPTYPRSTPR